MSSIYFSTAETLCIKFDERFSDNDVVNKDEPSLDVVDNNDEDEEGEFTISLFCSSTVSTRDNEIHGMLVKIFTSSTPLPTFFIYNQVFYFR